MITFFTVPKPFIGSDAIHQRNAIGSWKVSDPGCEVFLFGDEEGVAENAAFLGARHFAQVNKTTFGTPLLDSVFLQARESAKGTSVCFINADIIITPAFGKIVERIQLKDFLAVSCRFDLEYEGALDVTSETWFQELESLVKIKGKRHPALGSDIFLFPKESRVGSVPPFAVGRKGWDNWMIKDALRRHIPVIDMTPCVTLVHQNHSYGHVVSRQGRKWAGPESRINTRIIESMGMNTFSTPRQATHVLAATGLVSSREYWRTRKVPQALADAARALYWRLRRLCRFQ